MRLCNTMTGCPHFSLPRAIHPAAHSGRSGSLTAPPIFAATAMPALRTRAKETLSFAPDGNCEVRVACKPRFGADRYRQAAYEGEVDVRPSEVGRNAVQGGFEGGHPILALTSTGRPGQSPCSAPGRSRSHARS